MLSTNLLLNPSNAFPLQAVYSSTKSHYDKAFVIKFPDITFLKSYDTIVAEYIHSTQELKIFGLHSNTTKRHIHDFMNQFTPYKVDGPRIKHLTKFLRVDAEPSLKL